MVGFLGVRSDEVAGEGGGEGQSEDADLCLH